MNAVVAEHLPFLTLTPDQARIERAKAVLGTIYAWLDERLGKSDGACGDHSSMADCVAAPSLFYADWVSIIPDKLTRLRDYRAWLLGRPSVAKAVDGARPFRHYFPLVAPDRD